MLDDDIFVCCSFPGRFLIPEDGESTTNVSQSDIVQAADITTAQKVSTSQLFNMCIIHLPKNKIKFNFL